jgi:hypothetical protein
MLSWTTFRAHSSGIWVFASLALVSACGASSGGASPGKDAGNSRDSTVDGSKPPPHHDGGAKADGGGPGEAASACVPAIPSLSWKSPYAGWSKGIPTDPSFFPIAVWLQQSFHAMELSGLGINIYVGNNAGVDPLMASDLATLKSFGMYAIVGQDSVGLASIDDPTIVAWWMSPDEPDNAQPCGSGYGPPVSPSTLITEYDAYKKADPNRPAWLGLGQGVAFAAWEGRGSGAPPESEYVPASDIVGFDVYPYNACGGDANQKMICGQFWMNALGVDNLHMWSDRNQAVWTDFETTDISGTGNGPTPVETASEVWLALIHEANGILYFIDLISPSFREDGIFADPAMVTAVTALNQEIKMLAPELNSATIPSLVTVTSSNSAAPIDTMVKANGTTLYIFSAISRTGTATGSFTIEGMTGSGKATVVNESRSVDVASGKFSDAFAANGVHIYQIDLATVTCP